MYPHGSTDSLPYATMGSGSLNAMAVFESAYEEDLPRDKAVDLVTRAIRCVVPSSAGRPRPRASLTLPLLSNPCRAVGFGSLAPCSVARASG